MTQLERQYTTGVGWQTVEVTGGSASFPAEWTVDGFGGLTIALADDASVGLWITGPAGDFTALLTAEQDGNTYFQVSSDGTINHEDSAGETQLNINDSSFAWGFTTAQPGGFQYVNPGFRIFLGAGDDVKVLDSTGAQVIFQIDENGALHGKTGQALTFDL